MENGVRTPARRVLLGQVAPASHTASGSHKPQLLEDFMRASGSARPSAHWLRTPAEEVLQTPTGLRRRERPDAEQALVQHDPFLSACYHADSPAPAGPCVCVAATFHLSIC